LFIKKTINNKKWNESYSKQAKFSFGIGLIVLIVHIFLSIYLWFIFEGRERTIAAEVSTPLTVAYAVAVIKWIVDNQGVFKSDKEIGIGYLVMISIVVFTFLGCLVGGPFIYKSNYDISPESLNKFFVFVESSFGVLFSIVFADMFQDQVSNNIPKKQSN